MTDRKENRKHLYYLHELSDFKVDSDDPDVRGWPVKDVDNKVVGKVDNLLVSKEKKRVVYLDVEVDESIIEANHDPYGKSASGDVHEFINKEGENHLILPVGLARLNTDDNFVYTDRIDHRTFAETKRMEKGYDVDRDYEIVVLESYNRDRDNAGRNAGAVGDRDRDLKTRDRDTGMDGDRNRMSEVDRETNVGRRDSDSKIGTGDTGSNLAGRDKNAELGRKDRETELEEERRRMRESDRKNDFDNEGNIAGRSGTLADNDRSTIDRDRDALTGDESGKYSDRRRSGNIPEDDSFYDRGEFDYTKYRR